MEIGSATIGDALGIATAQVRSWQAAYRDIFNAAFLEGLSIGKRTEQWRDILRKQESETLVARQENEIAGFVSFGRCRDKGASESQGEIWSLYARPEVWGRGIGYALLKSAVQELRSNGRDLVSLWVLSQNHRGIAFYEAFGFRRVQGSVKRLEFGGAEVEEVCLRLPGGC